MNVAQVAVALLLTCASVAAAQPNDDVAARTEAALLSQLSCTSPPEAGIAVRAMMRNGLIRATDDGGDGVIVFEPTRRFLLLGFPVVRLEGWQQNPRGFGAVAPFGRGPGTAPPNYLSVTVRATADALRAAARREGLREASDGWSGYSSGVEGAGFTVEEGESFNVSRPLQGVSRIECSRWPD
jgi:hypothetical protein